MKNYNLVMNESGVWKVVTDPQVPGFHYYSLITDGVSVADPASESFYGMGTMASGIEIPYLLLSNPKKSFTNLTSDCLCKI